MEISKIVQSHLRAHMNLSHKEIIIGNFLGGLAWGFGTVVGAVVVVALLGSFLKTFGFFDGVESFLNGNVIINQTAPKLYK